ncbi:hypothetical protein DUI87_09033 [Hirundo rustica rustica]|uniref:Uncharacterized protein n=1 Tax=Hirundo rustica rustica TaxID=333673 RepID=A0A3M0KL20_HIRRU|nr:hypothetical protein DUI87_09033 [Hirundo rustica rustica]
MLQQMTALAQLGVTYRLPNGGLSPHVQIINRGVKDDWAQHGSLGDTRSDWPPTACTIHHPLGLVFQTFLNTVKTALAKLWAASFSRRMLWETVSKVLLESRQTQTQPFPHALSRLPETGPLIFTMCETGFDPKFTPAVITIT